MPPLPSFDSPQLLGALEIGAFISIFMFGTIVVQGHTYYKTCMNDSRWLCSLITLILVLELGHTISTAQAVWWATLTIADLNYKPGNGYDIAMCTLYSAIITFLVKAFYINRIRILTSKPWFAIAGWFIAALDFASSVFVSVETFLDVSHEPDNFALQRKWGWLITTSLGLAAVVDVFIAAVMVYHLRQFVGAARANSMKKSVELMNRLLIWTIETGLLTSVVSVAALICFQTMEFNYIWFAVYLPLAKLYSNSLLASLNARPARRRLIGLNRGVVQTGTSASSTSLRFATFNSSSSSLDGFGSSLIGTPISRKSSNSSARRSTVASSNVSRRLTPLGISYPRRSTVATPGGSYEGSGKGYPRKSNQHPHIQNIQTGASLAPTAESPNVGGPGKKKVIKDQYVYSKSRPARRISTSTGTSLSTLSSTTTGTPTSAVFTLSSSPASRLHSPTVGSIMEAR